MNLKRRIERLEAEMKPPALRAVIQCFTPDSVPPDRPSPLPGFRRSEA